MSYQKNCRKAIIAVSAAGNTTIIPANQLGTGVGTIKVWQVLLSAGAANTVTFFAGPTSSGDPIIFTANGGSAVLQNTEEPWFTCPPGQPFIINASGAGAVNGTVYYTLA